MDSKNTVISGASGGASASVRDALGNVIASSYIADVSWDSENRILSCLGASGNVIGSVEIPSRQWVDDPTLPLTLRAVEDNSSVTLNKVGGYSGGVVIYNRSFTGGWSVYTYGTAINLNAGEFVCFKVGTFPAKSSSQYCQFAMTGKIEAWHNVNSMAETSNFSTLTDLKTVGNYTLIGMFKDCTSLVKAPLLPATGLSAYCYNSMFRNTGITQAPALPATSFNGTYAYQYMFYGCSNLVQPPPRLPGKMSGHCFDGMFQNCTSLVQTPTFTISDATYGGSCCLNMFNGCSSLEQINITINYGNSIQPSTATNCFEAMFKGCTRITQPPSMAATNKISASIFKEMFSGCTSLAQAPTLPNATTLVSSCYQLMFYGCSSLSAVTCLATDVSAANCTTDWLNGVAASGDFYTPQATQWSSGASGIPADWVRHDI